MVKQRKVLALLPILLLSILITGIICTQTGWAADVQYHLEKQWVKIWVNTDGTIDLQYTIRIACDQGRISYVNFDQPVGDFKLGEAVDAAGHVLTFEDVTQGSDYKVRVYLPEPITDAKTPNSARPPTLGT